MADNTTTRETPKSRGARRKITGTVTSAKADKTVVVKVQRRYRDKHFHKFIIRRDTYYAHDEDNTVGVGDVVELIESRPYSKTKRWRVTRTVQKAREATP